MWHQTCSWLGWDLVQKLEGCRRVRTAGGLVRWATPSGMGAHSPVPAREAEKRPSGAGVAAVAAKLLQSCPTLCDPIDSSPPGSHVPGILQARSLEWVAISFSKIKRSLKACQGEEGESGKQKPDDECLLRKKE